MPPGTSSGYYDGSADDDSDDTDEEKDPLWDGKYETTTQECSI